ncbi:MAG: hypothetical protein WCJ51_05180 [Candidatus Moraniibacteriota bacterium]
MSNGKNGKTNLVVIAVRPATDGTLKINTEILKRKFIDSHVKVVILQLRKSGNHIPLETWKETGRHSVIFDLTFNEEVTPKMKATFEELKRKMQERDCYDVCSIQIINKEGDQEALSTQAKMLIDEFLKNPTTRHMDTITTMEKIVTMKKTG